jgi:putative ABC transport system permease protein
MAVGARGADILRQFLVEAITLSMTGGLIGILLGALSSWMIATLAGWQIRMSPESILLSVGFSAAIGIFFGYYPARKASNLLPIQALRYE